MASNKNQFWNKAMFWGFIIALVTMMVTTVFYATDNFFANVRGWIEHAVLIIGIVLCALAFRKTLTDDMEFPYSRTLGLGVATAFFASLILGLFIYVLFQYIDPDLISQTLQKTEEKLLESGLSDDMIEQQMELQSKFIKPSIMAVSTIFGKVLMGLIFSLITSIFLRKKLADGFEAAMNEINDEE